MPWEKTFDIDDAVDKATQVFWAKGYEAASLADLLKATGINKGSFYNAFGSKKKLFNQSLVKYEREQRRDTLAQLEALGEPLVVISRFFDEVIRQSLSDTDKKGCFLVNIALDLPNHDADTNQLVSKAMHETEAFFERQVRLGIANGDISAVDDPESTAKGLLALLVGLRVLARGTFDETSLEAIKAQAMQLIR